MKFPAISRIWASAVESRSITIDDVPALFKADAQQYIMTDSATTDTKATVGAPTSVN